MRQSQDPREIEPVKRVAARIIEAAKRSKYGDMAQQFQWEVTVIKDDKTLNAFALPGGKIAVYTGIFSVAKTEAGLAAVMGHEVVHASGSPRGGADESGTIDEHRPSSAGYSGRRRDGATPCWHRRRWRRWVSALRSGCCFPSAGNMSLRPTISAFCWRLMRGMIRANPCTCGSGWRSMSGGGGPAEFMSTHPGHETRIEQLKQWMPEAMAIYQIESNPVPAR